MRYVQGRLLTWLSVIGAVTLGGMWGYLRPGRW